MQSLGLAGVWHLPIGARAEGQPRAGLAATRQQRTEDGTRTGAEPWFGLGVGWRLGERVALELGWDPNSSRGRQTGGGVHQAYAGTALAAGTLNTGAPT